METDALGELQSPAECGDGRGNRIGLQGRAIGIREYQIQIGAVVTPLLLMEPAVLAESGRWP